MPSCFLINITVSTVRLKGYSKQMLLDTHLSQSMQLLIFKLQWYVKVFTGYTGFHKRASLCVNIKNHWGMIISCRALFITSSLKQSQWQFSHPGSSATNATEDSSSSTVSSLPTRCQQWKTLQLVLSHKMHACQVLWSTIKVLTVRSPALMIHLHLHPSKFFLLIKDVLFWGL